MRSRWARVVVVLALVGATVVVVGAPAASANDDHAQVGYTFGLARTTGPTIFRNCNFYRVDLDSGALHQVNTSPVRCGDGLTFSADGTLYAYREEPSTALIALPAQLITIDPDTGTQHVVGALPPVSVGSGGMTFDHDGRLWLYSTLGEDPPECVGFLACLWQVDPHTANATFVGTAPEGVVVGGLAGDCEDVLGIASRFVTNLSQGSTSAAGAPATTELDEVNTSNAALTKLVDLPNVPYPTGLDFDSEGRLWAIAGSEVTGGPGVPGWSLFLLDPDQGVVHRTTITLNGQDFRDLLDGLAISPISCEEHDDREPAAPPAAAPVVAVQPTFTG